MGKRIEIKARKVETETKQVPSDWLESVEYEKVLDDIVKEINSRFEKRKRWKARFNFVLDAINTVYPVLRPLTRLVRFDMPKDKAKFFFDKFQKAEGVKKWVYLVAAIVALLLTAVDVSYSVIILAVLAGVESAISSYEQRKAKEVNE